MSEGPRIEHATEVRSIRRCWPVMRQLRPSYEEQAFVDQVLRQQQEGYRLAYVESADAVVAVAGYRFGENLAWGKFVYVDDLVTDGARRSSGFGEALLSRLIADARGAGCDELHLDSGVQRYAAHRFYLRHRFDITSHHFRLDFRGD